MACKRVSDKKKCVVCDTCVMIMLCVMLLRHKGKKELVTMNN